jgi:hypothetical protein
LNYGRDDKAWVTNISRTGSMGVIHSFKNLYVYVHSLVVIGQGLCSYAYMGYSTMYSRLTAVECYDISHSCLCVAYGGFMDIENCVGWSVRGIYTYRATIVSGGGTAPAGSSVNVFEVQGGQVRVTFNHQAGSNPNAPAVIRRTSTWTNNDTHSVWAGSSATYWSSGYAYNGKRPSDPPQWYGIHYFNLRDFSELKNANGTPRKIISVRLKVRRTNNTGENTSRRPLVHWSNKTTASGTVPSLNNPTRSNVGFNWGTENWITLPIVFGERFRDGQARSIVYHDGNREADYMRFEAQATLEIVHE